MARTEFTNGIDGSLQDQKNLNTNFKELYETRENQSTALAASAAVPVTISAKYGMTSVTAETNTLADPATNGLEVAISLDVDGGNRVITAASAVNITGNNTLTFADAGDLIILRAVDINGALKWRVLLNDGVALSTV